MELGKLARGAWHSPVLTTLASYGAQAVGVAAYLPLLVRNLPPHDVAVILLFGTVGTARLLLDFGFSYTLMRQVAYAMASSGSTAGSSASIQGITPIGIGNVKWCLKAVYLALAAITVGILATVGAAAVGPSVETCGDPASAWVAWWVLVAAITLSAWSVQFSTWMLGTANVATFRRWEALFAVIAPLGAAIIVSRGGGVLAITLNQAVWQSVAAFRNWVLTRRAMNGLWARTRSERPDLSLLRELWGQTWRTGVGILASFGMVQSSAILYGRILSGAELASFLLGFRLISAISETSKAPFYSRVPEMFRHYAEADSALFRRLARSGMQLSHLLFVLGWGILACFGGSLLRGLEAQTRFPAADLWMFFGLAFLLQRVGAMHMQVVCAANRILTHVSEGGTALVYLVVFPVLIAAAPRVALPLGLVLSYSAFLLPYALKASRTLLGVSPVRYERAVSIPAVAAVAGVGALCWLLQN